MIDFINKENIKHLDPQNTYESTELLVSQCKEAWKDVNKITIPEEYNKVQNIVFCGMGASIYGALVFRSLIGNTLPYPIDIVTDYHLPNYVDNNSLIVLTSYSGTTEEVLSCAQEALVKNAKMLVLTKGGDLANFAIQNNIPSYIFDGKLNPSGVPRLGNGYTILGLLGLLNKAKIISIEEHEVENSIIRLEEKIEEIKGQAANDFHYFINKIPVIICAEHLSGNAQILRNQFNETSKTFACYFLIPDLNHHLMEGLQFPRKSSLSFLMINSTNYESKIAKRMQLTEEVIKKNKQDFWVFTSSGQTLYDDFLEVLSYGSFLTLFLAFYYQQNPAINPWVDWFKKRLKE